MDELQKKIDDLRAACETDSCREKDAEIAGSVTVIIDEPDQVEGD